MYPICVTGVLGSQIESFSLYGETFSSYRPFWEWPLSTEWPKWHLNTTRSQVPHIIFVSSILESQISHQFVLRPPVSSYRPFETSALNDLKWPRTLQGHRIYLSVVSLSPKFHPILLYDQPFSSYGPFWDTFTKCPPNHLEPYKVKCTPYTTILESQFSLCFDLWPSVFEIQAILNEVHQMTPKWPWIL